MREYLSRHLHRGKYVPREICLPDRLPYENRMGWKDYALGPSLLFSYRKTAYRKSTFDEVPHTHGFYELVVCLQGEVDYVCQDARVSPVFPAVILFRPGQRHTALLRKEGIYERYVFYFRPEVFGPDTDSFPRLFEQNEGFLFDIPPEQRLRLLELLGDLRRECETVCNLALCRAMVLLIFALIDRNGRAERCPVTLPKNVVTIRQYIDENFRTIRSVPEIAGKFFYTREHLTRLFRQSYNVTVSAYLIRRRLEAGEQALRSGSSVTRAALDSGFESLSAFTCAFRRQYGVTPSEYRNLHPEDWQ